MSDTESQPEAPATEAQPEAPATEIPTTVAESPPEPEGTPTAPESAPIAWEPPPPPDHPDAPPVPTEYGDGEKSAPVGHWPVEPTRPQPAFPESIRFESGHPEDLKAWLSDWIEWKFGR
jgi:hypothetical protein